jgi:hypothetical protein
LQCGSNAIETASPVRFNKRDAARDVLVSRYGASGHFARHYRQAFGKLLSITRSGRHGGT